MTGAYGLMAREGFAALLDAQPDIEVVGTAGDGKAALRVAGELAAADRGPDVVLMDVRMPELDGLDTTRRCSRNDPGPGCSS